MSPEDAPTEWVEKAAREVYAEWENEYVGDSEWPAWDSDENLARDTARTWARNILAAVLPEAMAEALEEAQQRVAGEDTVKRARTARHDLIAVSYVISLIDDQIEDLREGSPS